MKSRAMARSAPVGKSVSPFPWRSSSASSHVIPSGAIVCFSCFSHQIRQELPRRGLARRILCPRDPRREGISGWTVTLRRGIGPLGSKTADRFSPVFRSGTGGLFFSDFRLAAIPLAKRLAHEVFATARRACRVEPDGAMAALRWPGELRCCLPNEKRVPSGFRGQRRQGRAGGSARVVTTVRTGTAGWWISAYSVSFVRRARTGVGR